ncbi:MAG: PEP-CTERM sorting domain-containing protein [Myxococcales bacterium]|nr:PEP-CTERM sorting domain-containing protein [Myxococcales bacterium]
MLRHTLFAISLSLGALTFQASSAHADVPPPNGCNTPGASCTTAPPDYKSPGTCVTSKCQKALPDGSIEYDCSLCVPSDAGSAGAGGGAGAGGSPSTGGKKASDSSSDSSCSLRATNTGEPTGLLSLGLVLAGLALRRRRG